LDTGLASEGSFYTDEGGLDLFRRQYRPDVIGGMGGNYYPATTQAFVQSTAVRVSVLSKQPHGVATNKESGSLEVMLHR
jgi:hypothetical protein